MESTWAQYTQLLLLYAQLVSFGSSRVLYELNSIFPYPVMFAEDEQVSAV